MLNALYLYYICHNSFILSITHPHKWHVQNLNFKLFYMSIDLLFTWKQVISDRAKSAESIDTITSTIAYQDDNAPF